MELCLFSTFSSHIEELITKFLYDGPVAKPQQYSSWYRKKKSFLEHELRTVAEMNDKKREECSIYIQKWVCI